MAEILPVGFKAGILDQDNHELYFVTHESSSSNAAAVTIIDAGSGTIGVRRVATGLVTITSTRLADGDTFEMEVGEPDPEPLPPFETHLGTPVPA